MLIAHADGMASAISVLTAVTRKLTATAAAGEPELAYANATPYLEAFGTVTVAWRWLERAIVAAEALKHGVDVDFYRGKIAACRHFHRFDLPRALAQLKMLEALEDTALRMDETQF
jgi:hypothetical protein